MIAPLSADATMSAPVLRMCISRNAGASIGAAPGCAASRSIAWPPTIPAAPAASALSARPGGVRQDGRGLQLASIEVVAADLVRPRGLARDQRERLGEQGI